MTSIRPSWRTNIKLLDVEEQEHKHDVDIKNKDKIKSRDQRDEDDDDDDDEDDEEEEDDDKDYVPPQPLKTKKTKKKTSEKKKRLSGMGCAPLVRRHKSRNVDPETSHNEKYNNTGAEIEDSKRSGRKQHTRKSKQRRQPADVNTKVKQKQKQQTNKTRLRKVEAPHPHRHPRPHPHPHPHPHPRPHTKPQLLQTPAPRQVQKRTHLKVSPNYTWSGDRGQSGSGSPYNYSSDDEPCDYSDDNDCDDEYDYGRDGCSECGTSRCDDCYNPDYCRCRCRCSCRCRCRPWPCPKPIPCPTRNLQIVRGTFNNALEILSGSGFTVSRNAAATILSPCIFDIRFTVPFYQRPTFVGTTTFTVLSPLTPSIGFVSNCLAVVMTPGGLLLAPTEEFQFIAT